MSRLAQRLRGGKSMSQVTGTLTGSGSLEIPQGVAEITITAKGGMGGDNSWYNPGQPYIAPSGWVAPNYQWASNGDGTHFSSTTNQSTGSYAPSGPGQTLTVIACSGSGSNWSCFSGSSTSYLASGGYYTTPGQPYIAPSSGGGNYYGLSTTAVALGVTKTWQGGYGSTYGTTSTQQLVLNGSAATMSYVVQPGTSMSYSYEY